MDQRNKLTKEELLQKLNFLYDKEEWIKHNIKKLKKELKQLQQDKELLQTMIMYTFNRKK